MWIVNMTCFYTLPTNYSMQRFKGFSCHWKRVHRYVHVLKSQGRTYHFCSTTNLSCKTYVTDIQFWNNRKSLEGLSVRSVFFNVFQSLIVLLYVLDNDTNTVIKLSCFVGLCIEVWKIHKVTSSVIDKYESLKFHVIV